MSAPATVSSPRICWHGDKTTGPIRVLHLIAEPRSWHFFSGQAAYLRARGFEVHAASSPGQLLEKFGRDNQVAVHPVPISRRLSVGSDLVSVWRVIRILREVRPQILHAHFSKPGIIGMVASFLARTPVRVYHNHGMALSSARGWKRAILWIVERLACLLAHRVIYVAPSVLRDAARLRVCDPRKAQAILSANGLDFSHRFNPLLYGTDFREPGRRSLQIPDGAFVVGFVGRIFKIKGIEDLVKAWQLLTPTEPRLHLVMVGDFDPREPIAPWAQRVIHSDSRIHLTGFVEEPATVYPVMDVLVLPSYHEGLGYSIVEAAAMELPVIGTRIPGIVDALQEDVSGLLVAPGKPQELAGAIRRYIENPALASAHGKAGREFVVGHFRRSDVLDQILETYNELIERRIVGSIAAVDRRMKTVC
jgi:glycosyltransferase involved in cell wall biosynthesis